MTFFLVVGLALLAPHDGCRGGAGAGLYIAWARLRRSSAFVERALGLWPSDAYQLSLDGVNQLARRITSLLQHGYLRHYAPPRAAARGAPLNSFVLRIACMSAPAAAR